MLPTCLRWPRPAMTMLALGCAAASSAPLRSAPPWPAHGLTAQAEDRLASSWRQAVATAEPGAPTWCGPDACGVVPEKAAVTPRGGRQAFLAGLGVGGLAGLALGSGARPPRPPALSPVGPADVGLVAGGVAAWKVFDPLFDRRPLAPAGGRWKDCRAGRDTLNGVDRWFRGVFAGPPSQDEALRRRRLARREAMDRWSDMTLGAALGQPLGLAVAQHAPGAAREGLVYAESLALAVVAVEAAKHVWHRPRPFAHFCEPLERAALHAADAQKSFFSGHTALAFAAATAGGRIARQRGYRHAGALAATGYALATGTALLRLGADKHYFTDVLAGAAAGWGAGMLVTHWHAPPQATRRAQARGPAYGPDGADTAQRLAATAGVSAGGAALAVPVWRAVGKRSPDAWLEAGPVPAGGAVGLRLRF